MAAPADTTRRADAARRARRAERAPSGGWRTIAAKELADHLESVRFIVLLVVVGVAAIVPLYFISSDISSCRTGARRIAGAVPRPVRRWAPRASAASRRSRSRRCSCRSSASPSGSTGSTASAPRARCRGCSPSRSTATTSSTASSSAGIAVITIMLGALVAVTAALGIVRLGIIPSPEELARVVAWLGATVLYASFWLAFALLLSVVIRGAARAALVGFGTWLGLILFGAFLLPLVANALFPPNTSSTANDYVRLDDGPAAVPADLAGDAVPGHRRGRVMNPTTTSVLGVGQHRAGRRAPRSSCRRCCPWTSRSCWSGRRSWCCRDDDRDVRAGVRRCSCARRSARSVRAPRGASVTRRDTLGHTRTESDRRIRANRMPMRPTTALSAIPAAAVARARRGACRAASSRRRVALATGELVAGVLPRRAVAPGRASAPPSSTSRRPGPRRWSSRCSAPTTSSRCACSSPPSCSLAGAGLGPARAAALVLPRIAGHRRARAASAPSPALRLPLAAPDADDPVGRPPGASGSRCSSPAAGAAASRSVRRIRRRTAAAAASCSARAPSARSPSSGGGARAARCSRAVPPRARGRRDGRHAGRSPAHRPGIVDPAPTPPPDASFASRASRPLVMPNDDFYRIDTALVTPSWTSRPGRCGSTAWWTARSR